MIPTHRITREPTENGFRPVCSCGWRGREAPWWSSRQGHEFQHQADTHLQNAREEARLFRTGLPA